MRFLLGREDGSRRLRSGGDTGSGTIGTESRLYFLKAEAFRLQHQAFPEFSGETKKWV
jgi:hypothetical protein